MIVIKRRCSVLIGCTFPKGPAPVLELKKPLKRLAARFFQLSGPAPTLGSEPLIWPRASGVGIFVSPRYSVMFFLRRAWPWGTNKKKRERFSPGAREEQKETNEKTKLKQLWLTGDYYPDSLVCKTKKKFPVWRMQRDNEGERNAQGRDKQEIRGEFFVKDDISGTVKAILMVRHTNRRGKDGHFLTQNAHYIIRNRPMFFHKNTQLELDITPPRPLSLPPSIVTLSAGPCCGPSLGQSLSIYERG